MANKDYRYVMAQRKAEQFLKENDFHSIPINLETIAHHLNVTLFAKEPEAKGASGILLVQGNEVGIFYATHIKSDGFQRFSIAHEIGHIILEGHIEYILPDGDVEHISQSGFTSRDPYEIEADNFAAALLMPSEPFKKAMRRSGEGLSAIKKLADICKTSLLSTAIRYTEFAEEYCAIIVSEGDHIDYAFMSEPLKQLPDIEWITKGSVIPSNTLTYSFNKKYMGVGTTEEDSNTGSLSDWYDGYGLETQEDVIGLGDYGKTLTVVTVIQDIDKYEEEEDLEEFLQIRFR